MMIIWRKSAGADASEAGPGPGSPVSRNQELSRNRERGMKRL